MEEIFPGIKANMDEANALDVPDMMRFAAKRAGVSEEAACLVFDAMVEYLVGHSHMEIDPNKMYEEES